MKEFDYFTYAKLGSTALKFKPPVDYWLDHTDKGILTLHFTLPLEQPISADAPASPSRSTTRASSSRSTMPRPIP
ncbi:MAG: DUF1007 family protein [Hyphomicrobium sp.]